MFKKAAVTCKQNHETAGFWILIDDRRNRPASTDKENRLPYHCCVLLVLCTRTSKYGTAAVGAGAAAATLRGIRTRCLFCGVFCAIGKVLVQQWTFWPTCKSTNSSSTRRWTLPMCRPPIFGYASNSNLLCGTGNVRAWHGCELLEIFTDVSKRPPPPPLTTPCHCHFLRLAGESFWYVSHNTPV